MVQATTTREIVGGDMEVWQELERLRVAHEGVLKPAVVVEAATAEDSILHAKFEWNDSVAAHMHRLTEARTLIRSYEIRLTDDDDAPKRMHYYTNVKIGDDHEYRRTEEVLRADELRAQVRARLLRQMSKMRDELARFDEFSAIVQAMGAHLS